MNAEFQWWLLIVGIVIGGALVYLVLADLQADPADADEDLGDDPGRDAPGGGDAEAPGARGSDGVERPTPEGDLEPGAATGVDGR